MAGRLALVSGRPADLVVAHARDGVEGIAIAGEVVAITGRHVGLPTAA
jgi:hypothetical protein